MLDTLGARIKALRKQKDWSQRQLCEAAGLSARFLVQLEGGKSNASVQRLTDIALALDVSLVTLFSGLGPVDDSLHQLHHRLNMCSDESRKQVESILGMGGGTKVALIGLRGAGKSTIGRAVSERRQWGFVELDDRIRARAGMDLQDLFEYHGMDRYRELRLQVLDEVLNEEGNLIIEVGGSVVMDESAYALLRRRTMTVWLRATPYDHLQRVKAQGDIRPMAGRINPLGELRSILEIREPLYAQADKQLFTSDLSLEAAIRGVDSLF